MEEGRREGKFLFQRQRPERCDVIEGGRKRRGSQQGKKWAIRTPFGKKEEHYGREFLFHLTFLRSHQQRERSR